MTPRGPKRMDGESLFVAAEGVAEDLDLLDGFELRLPRESFGPLLDALSLGERGVPDVC